LSPIYPDRRRVLQLGGGLALTPMLPSFSSPAQAAPPTPDTLPRDVLWYRLPAADWQSQALPIGNGRVGAMLFGRTDVERIQFNEQSLWGGVNNYDNALAGQPDSAYDTSVTGFGSYRAFGDVLIAFGPGPRPIVTAPGGPYSSSATEGVEKTVDGAPGTKWCIDGPPQQVIWQAALAAPAAVSVYRLTSANDVPARDPATWTFQGSADGTTWTTLDTRTLASPFENRFQVKEFTCANTVAYEFYRLVFTPRPGVSHFQVAEVALDGLALRTPPFCSVSSPSGHADVGHSVDGSASTVWRAVGQAVWQADLSSPATVTAYSITASPDTPGEDPGSWTLEGSTDGVVWTKLDERGTEPPFRRGERREWLVGTPAAYTGYRLTLKARPASRAVRVAEVALRGADLDTAASRPVVEYRRALDLESGVHTTRFGGTGRRVTREAFASRAADLIVLRYEAASAGALDCDISLTSGQDAAAGADARARTVGFSEGARRD